ncbi:MAG: hypothetical protein FJ029_05240, partial [Actinobacteria bacterium]|nr:hypothetical protein [Actinomycetota bacterium]
MPGMSYVRVMRRRPSGQQRLRMMASMRTWRFRRDMAVGGRRLSRRSLLHAASAGLTTSGFLLIFNAIGGAVAAVPAAPAGAPTQPSGTGAQGLDPGAIAADAPLPALLPSDVAPTQ